jgi:Tol biopolymer transport system component
VVIPESANLEGAPPSDSLDVDLAAAASTSEGLIAFTSNRSGSYDIYVLDVATGRTHRITRDKGLDTSPAWSPDGKKIAFSGTRGSNADIYIITSGSGDVARLTTDGDWEDEPTWSPDGTKIAYSSGSGLGGSDIWVRNADGTGTAVNITNNAAWDSSPTWSPDGTKIAFTSSRGGSGSDRDIYIMNADGTGAKRLTLGGGILAAWSPDGQKIAFTMHDNDNDKWNVCVVNANGTGAPVNLTPDAAGGFGASWSPDGTKIAFGSRRDGSTNDIYVMNSDGSGIARVARNSGQDQKPAWQP